MVLLSQLTWRDKPKKVDEKSQSICWDGLREVTLLFPFPAFTLTGMQTAQIVRLVEFAHKEASAPLSMSPDFQAQ